MGVRSVAAGSPGAATCARGGGAEPPPSRPPGLSGVCFLRPGDSGKPTRFAVRPCRRPTEGCVSYGPVQRPRLGGCSRAPTPPASRARGSRHKQLSGPAPPASSLRFLLIRSSSQSQSLTSVVGPREWSREGCQSPASSLGATQVFSLRVARARRRVQPRPQLCTVP